MMSNQEEFSFQGGYHFAQFAALAGLFFPTATCPLHAQQQPLPVVT
jgi:hypothetical protein